ncbi:MAG: M48 family peptidase, partial [Chitinophagaceae bacterium]
SRNQETEADRLGLTFMAMAGYDPHNAITFWQRMAAQGNGQQQPEFLSTHPAEDTRIQKLQEMMPEALKYYKPMGK